MWNEDRVGSTPEVGNRCRVLSAVPAATVLILLSGCGNGDGTAEGEAPASSPVTSEGTAASPEGRPGGDQQAGLQFDDQAGDGSSAVVRTVSVGQDGFVVVSTGDGTVVGVAPVQAGTTDDVAVPLDPPLTQGATLTATLYADTDGNGTFDPGADQAVPGQQDGAEYDFG